MASPYNLGHDSLRQDVIGAHEDAPRPAAEWAISDHTQESSSYLWCVANSLRQEESRREPKSGEVAEAGW